MEHLVITIHPAQSDDDLLRVSDAMQHVIDYIKLFEEAEHAIASPNESFEWRLERASANSPFTVVARAEPMHPAVDVSSQVQKVKAEFSSGIRGLIENSELPYWMGPEAIKLARAAFFRNQNGIGSTKIKIADNETLSIDRKQADSGMKAISGISAIDVQSDLGARTAFGEIEGQMVAAGRFKNCPSVQIRTELYGYVWCQLSKNVIEKFGSEHKMSDIWKGKTIGVEGRLIYAIGGKLSRIEVNDIREMQFAPTVDLDSVLDPNFTSGLDPVEYIRQLHEGELV